MARPRVTQVLIRGGIKENSQWYLKYVITFFGRPISRISNYSWSWTVADEQYKWISNPQNGYINGDILIFHESQYIANNIANNNVQAGDLMYWDFNNDGYIDHTSVIVATNNGDIIYAQHGIDKIDGSLSRYLDDNPNTYVYVIRIKDDAQ